VRGVRHDGRVDVPPTHSFSRSHPRLLPPPPRSPPSLSPPPSPVPFDAAHTKGCATVPVSSP